jgi:hypothetical protein
VSLDDLCRDSGGVWCAGDVLWSSVAGEAVVILLLVSVAALVFSLLRSGARAVMSFRKEKHVDLEPSSEG